ncbi:isopentenyl-diphosphate delta-isomerase idi1 [Aspergillus tanneri]|uniref:isopentenyl-diphosphate Delta-isomerase n=1 Tax=Aspergillus tanneri TaxID=1220188 RepID=A0A5M9NDQ2_9EURO|nr:isopentenyl-diphosphate delta-isomerase idi1 [Aspergillus tanneri]KAA8652907.1 isopentenyl-diphosphate delta-isomerase idi1 [Aspergillus tanneri]
MGAIFSRIFCFVTGQPFYSFQSRITADNVSNLFPDVRALDESAAVCSPEDMGVELKGYDPDQILLMQEMCIVVDDEERQIGMASKKTCHLLKNIRRGLLHRAFSVLLFDSQNRLLLQCRASEKITWPDHWTNTCCSHPLAIPGETGLDFCGAILGAKRAAQRKLNHELGISPQQVPLNKLRFMTRMQYQSDYDLTWGEHEVSYIFILQGDIDLSINPNEIRDYRYVTREEFEAMYNDPGVEFTPWFKLMKQAWLSTWWKALEESSLDLYVNDSTHHRL